MNPAATRSTASASIPIKASRDHVTAFFTPCLMKDRHMREGANERSRANDGRKPILQEPSNWQRLGLVMLVAFVLLFSKMATPESATSLAPPDVVKLPAGLDLGGSSFYDAFGAPGWSFLDYPRFEHLTSIKDSSGQNSPLFVNPRIDVMVNLFHLIYLSSTDLLDGGVGAEALLPVIDVQSHFEQPEVLLHNNGLNIGDLTFGLFYQAHPTIVGGRPILCWRSDLDFFAPIGGFDSHHDINQSSDFWSVNPYISTTLLPMLKWEISTRFNYVYNLPTSRGANPPVFPGFTFHDGQAGQAAWINFASSYAITETIRPGINGFWLQQFTNDRTNGVSVPNTRAEELYLGPGLSWQPNRKNTVNFNVYLPVTAANLAAGPQFNIQFIHEF